MFCMDNADEAVLNEGQLPMSMDVDVCEHLSSRESQSTQTVTCRRIAPGLYEVPLPDCLPYRVVSSFVKVIGKD